MKTLLLAVAVITAGLTGSVPSSPQLSPRQEYDGYLAALRSAILAGDADRLGDLVTEDRVAVTGANGKTSRGRAAQVASDRAVFRGSKITSFEMRVTDFRSSGPMAYATGVGTHQVVETNGQSRIDRFQYVDILVRGSDGKWRSQYFMNAPVEPGQ